MVQAFAPRRRIDTAPITGVICDAASQQGLQTPLVYFVGAGKALISDGEHLASTRRVRSPRNVRQGPEK